MVDGVGNLYFVDAKLSPVEEGVICAPIIEINGINGGTKSFMMGERNDYYANFARTLGRHTRGRPMFLHVFNVMDMTELEEQVQVSLEQEGYSRESEKMERHSSVMRGDFKLHHGWLGDLRDSSIDILRKHGGTSGDVFRYLHAFESAGVPAYAFRELEFDGHNLEFELLNGDRMTVGKADVGMIRGGKGLVMSAPEEYQHLFLNSSLIEGVMQQKPYVHFLALTFNEKMLLRMPPSMPFGAGVYGVEEIIHFLELFDGDLVVRKSGGLYQGTGTEILRREELLRELGELQNDSSPAEENAILKHLGLNAFLGYGYERYISMYEQFMPSIPLIHPETRMEHDGCARIVVYSPPDGEPVSLGAQWRLASSPMGDDASLEERFRVNIAKGAGSLRPTEEHEGYLNMAAEQYVALFEQGIESFLEHIGSAEAPYELIGRTMGIRIDPLSLFQTIFRSYHMTSRLTNLGLKEDGVVGFGEVEGSDKAYDKLIAELTGKDPSEKTSVELGPNVKLHLERIMGELMQAA